MLKFTNGQFKIMQIADIQDTNKTAPDTIRFLEAAIDSEKPDLVVFTGDQVKGYGFNFKFGDAHKKVETALDNILSIIEKRKIPFTFCFGNHDQQAGMGKEEQLEFYRRYSCCMAQENDDPSLKGCANHTLPIYSGDGKREVFALYLIDSHRNIKGLGYEPVDESQINWYRKKRDEYAARNGGQPLPSIVFQHIPVQEVFQLLKQVKRTEKGAVQAFRIHKNEWYVLDFSKVNTEGFMRESPAIPDTNTGEFAAFREKGDVLGVYFGHDHNNSFHGKVDGIDLGYCQGCGFNVYGPGLDRGVRMFVLNEDTVHRYNTYDVRYRQLLGKKLRRPLKNFIYTYAPTNLYDALYSIAKITAGAAVVAAVIALLVLLLK